jgi:hypothetical protein
MTESVRTVLWRELFAPGVHWCELSRTETGWRLDGVVLTVEEGQPLQARYEIALDHAWMTRDVAAIVRLGNDAERRLRLTVDADQRWQVAREPASPGFADDPSQFAGLADIDLAISPATNTLPIRRLNLDVGESAAVTATWVQFPDLTLEQLPQRYTRLDERRYRYESLDGDFVAEIVIDDLGLVMSYEGLWERMV